MFVFQINQATHDQALVLQNALQSIPNPTSECMLRNVAIRLAQQISDEVPDVYTVTVVFSPQRLRTHLNFSVVQCAAEFLSSLEVHPGYLCDSSRSEDRLGFRLWNDPHGVQLKRRDQQGLREGALQN